MDIWNPEKRSSCMSKIKGANTLPEKTLRSALHRAGFRFRINVKERNHYQLGNNCISSQSKL